MPAVCPNKEMVDDIIEDVFKIIKRELKHSNKVELRGFGSFYVKELPGRYARVPKTGEIIKINARKKIKFRQGKELNSWAGHSRR
jgi:nucleoid DNA-binding protein